MEPVELRAAVARLDPAALARFDRTGQPRLPGPEAHRDVGPGSQPMPCWLGFCGWRLPDRLERDDGGEQAGGVTAAGEGAAEVGGIECQVLGLRVIRVAGVDL